jgi:hypothetical protein
MRLCSLTCILIAALWASTADAQNAGDQSLPNVQQIADTMVRLCLGGGRTQAVTAGGTGGADISLRSLDVTGKLAGQFSINKSSAEGLVNGIDNALTQVAADQADKVRDCLKPVRDRLLDAMLPHSQGLATPSASSVQQTEADVADNCRKLQFWPRLPLAELNQAGANLQKLSQEVVGSNLSVPTNTLATLNRCLAGYQLVSGSGPPDSLRKALPYLDRSLAYNPDQFLLRQNRAYLDQMLRTSKGDFIPFTTTVLQVLWGTDDPEIHDLANQLWEMAKPNAKQ